MDVARLRSLAEEVTADYENWSLSRLLQALEDAYAHSVQSPSSETAVAYEAAFADFMNAAGQSSTVKLSPAKLVMLEKLHATDLCGVGLIERVEQILSGGVSPATIVDGLQRLLARMTKFQATLALLRVGLDELGVASDSLAPDDAQAEINLPSTMYDGSLASLARESELLNHTLFVLVEAAAGSRRGLTARAVSTASLDIVVRLDLQSAVLLLNVSVQLLSLINNTLAFRQTRSDLERQEAPEQIQADVAAWHERQRDAALSQLCADVLAAVQDPPRRSELTGPVERAIHYLSDRFEKGMRVSIEVAGPALDDETELRTQIADLQQRVLELTRDITNHPRQGPSYSYPPRISLVRRHGTNRVSLPPMVR